jgi:hypothetical protein
MGFSETAGLGSVLSMPLKPTKGQLVGVVSWHFAEKKGSFAVSLSSRVFKKFHETEIRQTVARATCPHTPFEEHPMSFAQRDAAQFARPRPQTACAQCDQTLFMPD